MCFFTARVRSTREGTVFTGVCLSTSRGGTYLPRRGGGLPTFPVPDVGGTHLRRSRWGGVPTLARWGVYLPSQFPGGGYLPWMGEGGTYLGWGEGVPTLDGGGVPTLDGGRRYLPWMGEGGTYLGWGGVYLPFTGYATGGMPLAFMQEDCFFLFAFKLSLLNQHLNEFIVFFYSVHNCFRGLIFTVSSFSQTMLLPTSYSHICSFLLHLHQLMSVNVKLEPKDISEN